MNTRNSLMLALGGMTALAAAIGVGRFVYTPILPVMLEALAWSKADAGLVASANFLGYFLGAVAAGLPPVSSRPRRWLAAALIASVATTLAMAIDGGLAWFIGLRFVAGVASAIVIVCASTVVLERLAASGHRQLSAVHFAGVGCGIVISAAVVSLTGALGGDWRVMWLGAALVAAVGTFVVMRLVPEAERTPASAAIASTAAKPAAPSGLRAVVIAYGLVGLGYVITSTFLVTIVRGTPQIRSLEPWIWVLFGLAAAPSVALWTRLGARLGLANAFAIAALVEAAGVAASVEWVSIAGVCLAALLLGGTFMGLTALGLMIARETAGRDAQAAIGRMTASFSVGQMIGPVLAGYLFELTGSFRAPSLLAAGGLLLSAALAWRAARSPA